MTQSILWDWVLWAFALGQHSSRKKSDKRNIYINRKANIYSQCLPSVYIYLCTHIPKVMHYTFQSHHSPWRWAKGWREQVRAGDNPGWDDGQKEEWCQRFAVHSGTKTNIKGTAERTEKSRLGNIIGGLRGGRSYMVLEFLYLYTTVAKIQVSVNMNIAEYGQKKHVFAASAAAKCIEVLTPEAPLPLPIHRTTDMRLSCRL